MEKEINCPLCEWNHKVEVDGFKDINQTERVMIEMLTRDLGKHIYEQHYDECIKLHN